MGAGYSSDKATNIANELNSVTTEVVNKNLTDCSAKLKQYQANVTTNVITGGGNVSLSQNAGLASACVQNASNVQDIINDIASSAQQKHTTDKGAAATFQLASENVQTNATQLTQLLKQSYANVNNLKCDLDVLMSQANTFSNVNTANTGLWGKLFGGGGDITATQQSTVQSNCQQVANVNQKVANDLVAQATQSTATTIPSWLTTIMSGLVVLAIVGAVGGLAYLFLAGRSGDEDEEDDEDRPRIPFPMMRQPPQPMMIQQAVPPGTNMPMPQPMEQQYATLPMGPM
jgi:hypothetical protein